MILLFTSPAFALENRTKQVLETTDFSVETVLNDVYALVDSEHVNLFDQRNEEMDSALMALFDMSILRSKLEQFYTMLYYISSYATIEKDEFTIDRDLTIKLLISSRVFTDKEFPQNISNVYLSRKNRKKPFYKVSFSSDRVELGLNFGDGYGISKVGMEQEAQALVFYGAFSFKLRKKGENVEAYDFDGVDLFGNFGARGIVNVDINYVAVKSVEFHKASEMALVKAKVSRKEFEINKHTWLLSLVTKFVTDKSLQPLDW
ncbi:soluble lytic murein transglycosylase and related regulatory proteins [Candidatus Scalindua japonica]|uniref:Soluble lytic murein transglycosylase and related regulatory proteins n=2 Tax=Candidatus Scalindua japonica TaxID=1284222 RepID=A0A286TV42_9BACT|nr:soluble lytic murein transglycosylase and related regulatory proteins [Candidatus Scalindua japonica]